MNETIVKHLNFGKDAKDTIFQGIEKLTKAVSSTLGASGKCVILEDSAGNPQITKDGVTVADSIILLDPVENMGAKLLKEAARKTVPCRCCRLCRNKKKGTVESIYIPGRSYRWCPCRSYRWTFLWQF